MPVKDNMIRVLSVVEVLLKRNPDAATPEHYAAVARLLLSFIDDVAAEPGRSET